MNDLPKWALVDGGRWWHSRPPAVQKLLLEFPPSQRVWMHERTAYVIGCAETEDGSEPMIKLSWIDPQKDYEGALADHFHVHAEHLRNLEN